MTIEEQILANQILRNVMDKFKNQQVKGLAKYGETVNPKSHSVVEWLEHKQQELIDATVYSEVLIDVVSKIVEGNEVLMKAYDTLSEENKRLREELAKAIEFADYKLNYSNQLLKELVEANEKNERLSEALEKIVQLDTLYFYGTNDLSKEVKDIARKALEESK